MKAEGDKFVQFEQSFKKGWRKPAALEKDRGHLDEFMTADRILEIAGKQWRNQDMLVFLVTLMKNPDTGEHEITNTRNITKLAGPKTVDGKIKALMNLRPRKPKGHSRKGLDGGATDVLKTGLVDDDEIAYYDARKKKYLHDFPNINESADAMALHEVIMCEVQIRRIYGWLSEDAVKQRHGKDTKKTADSIAKLTTALKTVQTQLFKAHENLGINRQTRLRRNPDGEAKDDLSSLLMRAGDDNDMFTRRNSKLRDEEEAQMRVKAERDKELGIEDGVTVQGEISGKTLEAMMGAGLEDTDAEGEKQA